MPCPHADRCALFKQFRLDSTLQVVKSNYCETKQGFASCARYQSSERGVVPAAGLLPSGKILPIFDGKSGVRPAPVHLSAHLVAHGDHYMIATLGEVLVTCWYERITSAGLVAADAAAQQLLANKARYAVLNLVDDFIPLPTLRLQQEAATLMARTSHAVTCSATVLRGESMWVRAARPVLGMLSKLALTSYPMAAFGTVEDAAAWIGSQLPTADYPPAAFATAIHALNGEALTNASIK